MEERKKHKKSVIYQFSETDKDGTPLIKACLAPATALEENLYDRNKYETIKY